MQNIEFINELTPFMLSNKNISKFPAYCINKQEIKKPKKIIPLLLNLIFFIHLILINYFGVFILFYLINMNMILYLIIL